MRRRSLGWAVLAGALFSWAACGGKHQSSVTIIQSSDDGAGSGGEALGHGGTQHGATGEAGGLATGGFSGAETGTAGDASGGGPPVASSPECTNGVRSEAETDIDCGGPDCEPCVAGASCARHVDCESQICLAGLCAAAACNDETTNGTESDVDCGGSACPKCSDGAHCTGGADCKTGVCGSEECQPPSCEDDVKNGSETAVDCGGGCGGCGANAPCKVPSDCESEQCFTRRNQPSTAPTCTGVHCINGVKDEGETDIDCGGLDCDRCLNGEACNVTSECHEGDCVEGVCHQRCSEPYDCPNNGACDNGLCRYCEISQDCPAEYFCPGDLACTCLHGQFLCRSTE